MITASMGALQALSMGSIPIASTIITKISEETTEGKK